MAILVGDHVPKLSVEASCETVIAENLTEQQSYDECMRDENAAQEQLATIWLSTPGPVRDQCESEAVAGGYDSYVDLLTCMQMSNWANASHQKPALRGASKKQYKN